MRSTPIFFRDSNRSDAAGFSLLEAVVSAAISAVLVTAVFAITAESIPLLNDVEADHLVQIEVERAMRQIIRTLNKSGKVSEQRVQYPRVLDAGSTLEFRLAEDLDGDGYPFDRETGAIEWSPDVFSIRRDPKSELCVFRSGAKIHTIARDVRFLQFETIADNSALDLNEISIALEIRHAGRSDRDFVASLSASAHMRN